MTPRSKLINYFVVTLTQMLMETHKVSFDWALSTILASQTYSDLVNNDSLINEGDLFVFEQLEKELIAAGVI